MITQNFSTERLNIKHLNQELLQKHVHQIFELYSNETAMKYSGFGSFNDKQKLIQIFEQYLSKENFDLWLMINKSDDGYIGDISISYDKAHSFGSVACFLKPNYWGKDYAKEALKEILFTYFTEYGFHRIEAQIHEHNFNSIRFFEKFGFQFEGILRQNFLLNGTFYNSKMYSLLFDEYFEKYIVQ